MDTKWTADEISTLRTLWATPATTAEIGAKLNRNRDSITGKARWLKLPKRKNPAMRHADVMAEHLAEGLNIMEAGKAMGLPFAKAQDVFRTICKELGPQAR